MIAGDRNTEKAKTTRVSQHRILNNENVLCFKFLFKTAGASDRSKFSWKTVPLCWTGEYRMNNGIRIANDLYRIGDILMAVILTRTIDV